MSFVGVVTNYNWRVMDTKDLCPLCRERPRDLGRSYCWKCTFDPPSVQVAKEQPCRQCGSFFLLGELKNGLCEDCRAQ